MKSKKLYVFGGLVLLGAAWYLFRPELLFVNARVNEQLPTASTDAKSAAQTTALAKGEFHGVAHETKGTATIHQTADGQRVLRFTGFETSNGPAMKVYLVAAPDAKDNAAVTSAGFVDLGSLKGNIGDQNYSVPADVDLSKYKSVTIWCSRFGVNFATAPLQSASSPSTQAPVSLAMGQFHGVAHEGKGVATLHQLQDGKRVLRFTDFQTSNGPALKVYLVAAADANDSATITKAGFVDLGSLKGNVGDQNYDVPANVDLSKYQAVSVWCSRFNVNFATAPLTSRN
jgi:hypothetical protein